MRNSQLATSLAPEVVLRFGGSPTSKAQRLWIERHTDRKGRARLLVLLGRGNDLDNALRPVVGVDLAGLERSLQDEIQAEFPQVAPASGAE